MRMELNELRTTKTNLRRKGNTKSNQGKLKIFLKILSDCPPALPRIRKLSTVQLGEPSRASLVHWYTKANPAFLKRIGWDTKANLASLQYIFRGTLRRNLFGWGTDANPASI